jgi:RNA recognition motif-containing protein
MSSDYRPRGAGGGSSSGGGGRRRRGGRGRSGGGHSSGGYTNESRGHSNGTSGSAPKKKTSFIDKLLGFFGKKSKPAEIKPLRTASSSRPDFKERAPRDERPRDDRPKREDRPKTEPVMQEITSPKLYVGNLAYEAAESDLFDLFSKVGSVKNVEIAMDRRSNRSKGFGFVEMESLDTAKAAADKLNRTDFMGRQIVVSGAKVDKRPINNPREEDSTAHEADPHSSNPEASA